MIGHEQILAYFNKAIENDRLHHAYCFVGPDNVGKLTLIKHLASQLLNVKVDKLNIQPDFTVVKQEHDEKTGKLKKDISIKQIRELRSFLSLKSFVKSYKIAIIDAAEKMNILAANALLKTLEEPRGNTVLFLITNNTRSLPDTILSRCHIVHFRPVSSNTIQKYLEERGIESSRAQVLSYAARGLPGKAIAWLEDEELFIEHQQEADRFCSLFKVPLYEKMQKVEDLYGKKTDHIAQRQKISSAISIWQSVLHDVIYSKYTKPESNGALSDLTDELCIELYNRMTKVKHLINKNIHPRLLIEYVLLGT